MFGAEFHAALQAEMAQQQKRRPLPFDAFPQEIKSHIVSFVGHDLKLLKSIRLVSHNLANTAAPFLFNELLLTPWSIGRFRDKRSRQTIQPYIRNITLLDAVLPKATLAGFSKRAQLAFDPWSPDKLQTRFNRYQSLYSDQEHFLEELKHDKARNGLIACVRETFHSLHGLTIVAVESEGRTHRNADGRLLSLYGLTQEAVRGQSLCERCEVWHDAITVSFGGQHLQHAQLFIHTFLDSLVDTTVRRKVRLRSLAANNAPCSFGWFLQGPGTGRRLELVRLFDSLVFINLDLCPCETVSDKAARRKVLTECLCGAGGLEVLRLDGRGCLSDMGRGEPLAFSLSTKSLRSLHLRGMYVSTVWLQSFLRKHYGTLETLELDDFSTRDEGQVCHERLGPTIHILAAATHVNWACAEAWVILESAQNLCYNEHLMTRRGRFRWEIRICETL
ncbi:MAG: hypothetical protein Q9169_005290 [Polycauliona sp. 2 TL-2023]